jgi:hypothetical protein
MVTRLGTIDEMRTGTWTSAQEYLSRFSRPRLLVPQGSTIQPEDWADPDAIIEYNPSGKPEYFALPEFPQMGTEMLDRADKEMESISGVAGAAMGQTAGSVRSADQQNTLIERATVAITQVKDNGQDFYERLNRVVLQEARRWFTTPQLVEFRGDAGAYQAEEFSRADFGSTRQVKVQRASFTMLTPTGKNELIAQEMQLGGLTPEEGARLRRGNISSLVGAQDNPHILRVNRQLAAWRKGPPEVLPQPQPAVDPATGGPPIDPMTGAPAVDPMTGMPPMQDPVAMAAAQIFPILPVDEEQTVALLRHQELSRAVAEMEFSNHPPAWGQALLAAYDHARRAAGIATVAEQAQAAQMQAQQQAQQAGQEREGAAAEADKGHQRQMEMQQMKGDQQVAANSVKMAA